MPKRGGRRVQLKRLRFQLNRTIILNKDPFPFLLKLNKFENQTKNKLIKRITVFKLNKIDFEIKYPNYKQISKKDPRYKTYKIRFLFGID